MRLEGVAIMQVALARRAQLRTSAGVHRARPVILVRLRAGGVEGWGECGALEGGTAVDPPLERVWETLVGTGVPRLVAAADARGGDLPRPDQVARLLDTAPAARMAAAALEMAVLDVVLRGAGTSLARHLGAERSRVPVGAVVGIPEPRRTALLLEEVRGHVAAGVARVRLKIAPGWDAEPAAAVVGEFPGLAVQVDANGAYRLGTPGERDAEGLRALDGLGLVCVEQPLAPPDLVGHAALAEVLDTPVCLDESLTTPERLRDALRYGACEVACLKPARLGGLAAARRAERLSAQAGVPAFVGGLFETGLARSANAAVAGLAGFTLPGDLTDPDDYLADSPFPYPSPVDGWVDVPTAAGVGPAPRPGSLEPLVVRVAEFPGHR